ncbi:MAG: riboflavin biosynthesis protein RibF [Flavobacteriaceae bacterium TMED68]|nr:MAG: riboflavin biosynthesis protein RibF [Flavobacteriaceae bacterium TMED68]|tara:strand:- start:18060 stop:18980 length:921 start_codon:yes stop_codon:yes gene_type:complete
MDIIQGIQNYTSASKSILTIGTFDGVHVGHQKIINALVKDAKEKKLKANLLTFFPHPRMILKSERTLKLIDTIQEKEIILKKLGIDNLIIHPFSLEFSKLSAVEYVRDILLKKLKICSLYTGYNHHFGKNKEASVDDLILFGKKYGFDVRTVPAENISSITVSSTKIRDAILNSNFGIAKKFLGRDYELNGVVIKGKGLGKTINFPTANLSIKESYKLIPSKGVYLVRVYYNNNFFEGMMNIGNRPTIQGIDQTQEVHIFNFNKNIYGEYLKVLFLKKIRDEKKFNSIEDLKNQLIKDKNTCKRNL